MLRLVTRVRAPESHLGAPPKWDSRWDAIAAMDSTEEFTSAFLINYLKFKIKTFVSN